MPMDLKTPVPLRDTPMIVQKAIRVLVIYPSNVRGGAHAEDMGPRLTVGLDGLDAEGTAYPMPDVEYEGDALTALMGDAMARAEAAKAEGAPAARALYVGIRDAVYAAEGQS